MQLSKLFNDDKAVSPVIGVILMVAITVILAAVIGTFVLGLGDSISDTTPSASINGEFDGDATITFTHQSGQNIEVGNLLISDSNGEGLERGSVEIDGNGDDSFSAGATITYEELGTDTEGTARLVFDSGSTSSTLASVDYDTTEEE